MDVLGTPFAHAEMMVLVHGMKKLGSAYLSHCHIYVTRGLCTLCPVPCACKP
jgi:tRNA(Arg) A34 adenosine deaminase TadA